MNELPTGQLILVPVPLGNLGDITLRAIEWLKKADIIFAEDTRQTGLLLQHLEIKQNLKSFHQHNEHGAVKSMMEWLKQNKNVVLVSDAGTPGISDPGFLAVREAIQENIPVTCLPGPTALIPALVMSGIPCHRFVFDGFLPQKKGRQKAWEEIVKESRTVVLYESPHRIQKMVEEMGKYLGPERKVALVREISKMFEQVIRGSVSELLSALPNIPLKGEFVVIIAGHEAS